MQAPQLYEITAFDAENEAVFSFRWTGNQAMGSRLTIRTNEDNEAVFTQEYTSMKQNFVLPAGTLENGVCYNAFLEVLDGSGAVISERSNVIVFYCYSAPSLTFQNIEEHTVIENSGFTVTANYAQAENEPLAQYQIALYDIDRNLIQTQGIQYLHTPVSQISAPISALENGASYYVRATGETLNHMPLDTGYILISVKYLQPSMFSFVDLQNIRSRGCISITSNLITLRGISDTSEEELEYIDGTMVDLSKPGRYVAFSEGFAFSKDWTLAASILKIPRNQVLLSWDDGTFRACLYYRQAALEETAGIEQGYFELQVQDPFGCSVIVSDFIDPVNESSKYTVWITRKGHLYRISLTEELLAEKSAENSTGSVKAAFPERPAKSLSERPDKHPSEEGGEKICSS